MLQFLLAVLNCLHIASFSQTNLVSNGNFEDYTSCPNNFSQIDKCIGWHSAGGTPDYYNTCGTMSFSIPGNWAGTQPAANGYGYAGFISAYGFGGFPGREYLYTELNQPLVVGTRYYLSMKVVNAELWGWYDDESPWMQRSIATLSYCPGYIATNKMGMRFTKSQAIDQYSESSFMTNYAHYFSQAIINDTTNWQIVSGSFVADSAYTRLVIGDFFDNFQTDTVGKPCMAQSYYYLDNVIVSSDSLALSVEENKQTLLSELEISPNPAHSSFRIKASAQKPSTATFYVSDFLGGVKYRRSEHMRTGENYFDETLSLPAGIYFLSMEIPDHARAVKKIIIE